MNYSDWIVSHGIPVKTNELFEQNKSFYRILEELNNIYE